MGPLCGDVDSNNDRFIASNSAQFVGLVTYLIISPIIRFIASNSAQFVGHSSRNANAVVRGFIASNSAQFVGHNYRPFGRWLQSFIASNSAQFVGLQEKAKLDTIRVSSPLIRLNSCDVGIIGYVLG